MIRWIFILTTLLWVLPPPATKAWAQGAEVPLRAGASKVKITPSGSVYMAGFGPHRKSQGVHDELYARCLSLQRGGAQLTIVALDLIGLLRGDVREIVGRVQHVVGKNVIIASTHTHAGPDTIGWWGPSLFGLLPIRSGVDGHYMAALKSAVCRAILESSRRMRKVEVRVARTQVLGLSRNIRKASSIDPELIVMEIRAEGGGAPVATLVHFACHPETLSSDNRLLSADFPGYLCEALEQRRGGVALFLNGALGGMVTVAVKADPGGRELRTFQEAKRIGLSLAGHSLEALRGAESLQIERLRVRNREILIPLENFRFRLVRWLGVIQRPLHKDRVKTEVWHVDMGAVKMVTAPGEMLPNLGLRLKGHMRGKYRLVLGLANDELGYILSREDYQDDLYAYERSMSVGPEAGPLIYEGIMDLISR